MATKLTDTGLNLPDGTTQTTAKNSLSDFGVSATATELNRMSGVTGNIQSALNGKLSSNQTITISGDASGTGSTSISLSLANNSVSSDEIAANSVGASELNVSGNGTSGQVLTSDGDGTFSWSNKTQETYSTASELLTAIKTVDGSGSGLDADTLDGISSASFLRSDATVTATVKQTFTNEVRIDNGSGNTTHLNYQDGGSNFIRGTTTYIDTLLDLNSNNIVDVGSITASSFSGDGSALTSVDADTLDGVQGSSFLRSDTDDIMTATLTHSYGSVIWSHSEATHRPVSKITHSQAGSVGTTGSNITDVYGEADISGITNDVTFTYAGAWDAVEARGGRLPTLAEVMDGVGAGSGQGYDSEYIWTCTPAGPHHVWVIHGNNNSYKKIVDITDSAEVYRTRCFFDVSRDGRQLHYSHDGNAYVKNARILTTQDKTSSSSDPTITSNPTDGAGSLWANYSNKKLWLCYDGTTNANKWINIHDSSEVIQPNQAPTNPTNTGSFPSSANKNTSFTFTFSGATDSVAGSGTPSVTHYRVDNIGSSYLTVSSAEVSAGSAHSFSVSNSLGTDTSTSFRVRAKDNNGDYSSGVTVNITLVAVQYTAATGGTVTTSGNNKIHTFTSSGTLSVSTVGTSASYSVFAIGGGGGGGNFAGGGGGAGGVTNTSGSFSGTGNYTVTVGAGGGGVSNGNSSSFNGHTGNGGGRGGSNDSGQSGGCGGGGSNQRSAGGGNQGYDGGFGQGQCTSETGGGGGGMGAQGAYGYCNSTGGAGGNGSYYSVPGGTYGGGGGGGSVWSYSLSNGGSGGGGKGGTYSNQGGAQAGTANTGGGGGGNSRSGGRAGGSGKVVIVYQYQG